MASESDEQIRAVRKLWKYDRHPLICHAGAFVGDETQALHDLFEKRARIFAFEPDPRNVEVLEARFEISAMIRVVDMALGDSFRRATFYPSKTYKGRPWSQSGSVCEPTDQMKVLYPRLEFGEPFTVDVTTLDCFFTDTKPDIIYCDVQGAEHQIINGGTLTLQHARLFFTEYYDREIYKGQHSLKMIGDLLATNGKWKLAQKFPWAGDGSCGDALFERID